MATLTTAEAAIARLEAHGVRQAFGIPGSHNLPLYRCLAGSSIAHVTPRHEQGAGYAADGYARAGGGPAVCIATSGPGVLNLATAVATAYADSVPMLILAPGMSDSVAGRDTGHLHEARDQRGAMEGVAASAVRVGGPAQAAAAIDGAFAAFASGRPRPAYVEIPLDAMEATGDLPAEPPVARPPPPDREAVAAAVELLRDAERAAIVLGGGAVDAGAEALELARVLGSPVITTANGKGTVPSATRPPWGPRSGCAPRRAFSRNATPCSPSAPSSPSRTSGATRRCRSAGSWFASTSTPPNATGTRPPRWRSSPTPRPRSGRSSPGCAAPPAVTGAPARSRSFASGCGRRRSPTRAHTPI